MNTLNVKRCNEIKTYKARIKEKEHGLDVATKHSELESTTALGNHLVIKEADILYERQGRETFCREWMFWAEKIAQYKTNILKEIERENNTIS